jgi:predicted nucleic acid-binding protein
MNQIVIADTSCLIVLNQIQLLHLLSKLFDNVKVTKEISDEFLDDLPDWVEIVEVKDKIKKNLLSVNLDKGEASAIAYCIEQSAPCLLIIDEKKGRKTAFELGISIIGTLGILLLAKKKGFIASLKESIEAMEAFSFRISPILREEILKEAGE